MQPASSQQALNSMWCSRARYRPSLIMPFCCSSSHPPILVVVTLHTPFLLRKDLFSNTRVHITGFWCLLQTTSNIYQLKLTEMHIWPLTWKVNTVRTEMYCPGLPKAIGSYTLKAAGLACCLFLCSNKRGQKRWQMQFSYSCHCPAVFLLIIADWWLTGIRNRWKRSQDVMES